MTATVRAYGCCFAADYLGRSGPFRRTLPWKDEDREERILPFPP